MDHVEADQTEGCRRFSGSVYKSPAQTGVNEQVLKSSIQRQGTRMLEAIVRKCDGPAPLAHEFAVPVLELFGLNSEVIAQCSNEVRGQR
jgi:hypothetical protein